MVSWQEIQTVKAFLKWFVVNLKLLDLHFTHGFISVLPGELESFILSIKEVMQVSFVSGTIERMLHTKK
jgi:hypothetical protein